MNIVRFIACAATGLALASGCAESGTVAPEESAPATDAPAASPEAELGDAGATAPQAVAGNNVYICRGGSAPVRYWNSLCEGGTVHAYYPQGWHGWFQSGVSCDGNADVYFHPNNGAHGGYVEQWRLCGY